MEHLLVSICVPTRNRAAYLRESLRTICAQDYSSIEILISDDESTDETEQLCREVANCDKRVRYVRHSSRLGLYPNHNYCIEASRGEFLCLFHDDDQHHPRLVSESVAFLLKHPQVGIVCSNWELLDENGQKIGVRDHAVPAVTPGLDYITRTIRSGRSSVGCPGAVIRKSALGSIRLREDGPIGFADFVVWFQIAERWSVGHIPQHLWKYRLHPRSFSRRTLESQAHDYYENLNRYCDEHLARWPEHGRLVQQWRRDINRYLFWALLYELGLHFRRTHGSSGSQALHRSVFEVSDYSLTPQELESVRAQLRRYRTGPLQAVTLPLVELLQGLRITRPLGWITQHAARVRTVLGLQ